jgi:glycerol kinase
VSDPIFLLGIDVSTTATKALLIDQTGKEIVASSSKIRVCGGMEQRGASPKYCRGPG